MRNHRIATGMNAMSRMLGQLALFAPDKNSFRNSEQEMALPGFRRIQSKYISVASMKLAAWRSER